MRVKHSSQVQTGWHWPTSNQEKSRKVNGRTYHGSVTYFPPGGSKSVPPMQIKVEDIVATEVDESDEETAKLKLKYWIGQVAALFEEPNGDKKFVFRFFDQASQWRYMNGDDRRLAKAFGGSFRKHEILETDVCEENPIEIILAKVNWYATEEQAESDYMEYEGAVSHGISIPSGVFSDRLIVRCGSEGKRRHDLSESLWPAPFGRRRNRLLAQCPTAVYSISACADYSGELDYMLGETTVKTKVGSLAILEAQERAIEALKLSVLPANLPCREAETAQIREFVKTAVSSTGSSGNVLYISGMPGTGKTASVMSVVNGLLTSGWRPPKLNKSPTEPFKFVYINSMKLNKPTDLFVELCNTMYISVRSGEKHQDVLTKFFSGSTKSGKSSSSPQVTLLLVDEIDYLVTKSQQVVYQLFDWPLLPNSTLVLVTISNTMDLPERLMPRVASRIGLARLNYLSYSADQIKKVVSQRLQEARAESVFNPDAIAYVAQKVANSSGDLRKALHICRRAIEIVQGGGDLSMGSAQRPVTVKDAHTAQHNLYSNPYEAVISKLSYFARMVLTSLCLEVKERNADCVSLASLWRRFETMSSNFQPPDRLRPLCYSDFVRIIDELQKISILNVSTGASVTTPDGDDDAADGTGSLVSCCTLLEPSDVKNALVGPANDHVAQRLL